VTVRVTENERAMLLDVLESPFQDGNEPVGHAVWTDELCETRSHAAILGSLVKKGLLGQQDRGREAICWLTAAGGEAIAEELAAYRAEHNIDETA